MSTNRFAPKGALDEAALRSLVDEGRTLREIATALERSIATVRYWMKRYGIERAPRRSVRRPLDPSTAPREIVMSCAQHGITGFVLEGRGSYRCKRCRQERVSTWRRSMKRRLVEEAGGRCVLCGYDRCVAALQFHHVDPTEKAFALSHKGLARSLDAVRAEAAKCVLLCATCHAEVEAGYTTLDAG